MSSKLLRVHCEQIRDKIVVHAVGEIDLATAPTLDEALSKAIAGSGARWVVVNLTKIDFLAAIGLTVLLTATRHGDDTGVPVVVVTHPGQPAHRTITITGLHHKLALIDSVDHALVEKNTSRTSRPRPAETYREPGPVQPAASHQAACSAGQWQPDSGVPGPHR